MFIDATRVHRACVMVLDFGPAFGSGAISLGGCLGLGAAPRFDTLDRGAHQPTLKVYVERPDFDEKAKVVLQIDTLWGQPMRWAEMSAAQARKLAEILQAHAEMIEESDVVDWQAMKAAVART